MLDNCVTSIKINYEYSIHVSTENWCQYWTYLNLKKPLNIEVKLILSEIMAPFIGVEKEIKEQDH